MSQELFYNNLNALRILEYTILDELAVGTASQNAFTTADWYWLPASSPAPAVPAVYAEIRPELQRLFATFIERVGGARPAWSELVSIYDPQRIGGQATTIKAFLREVLSLRLFACQNREGKCTKQET